MSSGFFVVPMCDARRRMRDIDPAAFGILRDLPKKFRDHRLAKHFGENEKSRTQRRKFDRILQLLASSGTKRYTGGQPMPPTTVPLDIRLKDQLPRRLFASTRTFYSQEKLSTLRVLVPVQS